MRLALRHARSLFSLRHYFSDGMKHKCDRLTMRRIKMLRPRVEKDKKRGQSVVDGLFTEQRMDTDHRQGVIGRISPESGCLLCSF